MEMVVVLIETLVRERGLMLREEVKNCYFNHFN
jgi:hypothetical protein